MTTRRANKECLPDTPTRKTRTKKERSFCTMGQQQTQRGMRLYENVERDQLSRRVWTKFVQHTMGNDRSCRHEPWSQSRYRRSSILSVEIAIVMHGTKKRSNVGRLRKQWCRTSSGGFMIWLSQLFAISDRVRHVLHLAQSQ
jgi:hypothetical protein